MKIDGDMAEIMGMHIGDGCISENSRYSEYYLGGDITEEKDYHLNYVRPLFNKKVALPVLGKRVNYKEHPKVGIIGFHIFRKEIVDFFKKLGIKSGSKIKVRIPKKLIKDDVLMKRFLRGLFDTDGNLYFDKNRSAKNRLNNRPTISIGTVSGGLAKDVRSSLINLGFSPRIKKPYKGKRNKNLVYVILLYRIKDIFNFISEIGFKNPKHSTKWLIFKKYGFCPSHTNIKQRKEILKNPKLFNRYFIGYPKRE